MANGDVAKQSCLRCGAQYGKGEAYCGNCGAPVVNRCLYQGSLLGEPCGYVNPPGARYCVKCGSQTAYHKAGLLHSTYPENKALEVDEMADMDWFDHKFFM